MLGLLRHGYTCRQALERSIPVLALTAAYVVLWLSQANRNFFVSDGHYALGFHFLPVYGRALIRLLSPAIPFAAALLLLRQRKAELPWSSSVLFFAAILVIAIVPYSFLTYQDHLPSRNTYFPSVGLAGLIGICFAGILAGLASDHSKRVGVAVFAGLIIGNIGYIWFKKEPQFRERAAPTRELFDFLNSNEARRAPRGPLYVCGFPLEHPWWFDDAVSRFTPFSTDDVVLRDNCIDSEGSFVLTWDSSKARYFIESGNEREPSNTVDAVADGKTELR
jgi:hypothetical protein